MVSEMPSRVGLLRRASATSAVNDYLSFLAIVRHPAPAFLRWAFGIGFPDPWVSFCIMAEEPKEPSKVRTIYLPVGVATVFALVLYFAIPQVGLLAVGSAWVGTVLFMSIWGSFYS